MRLPRTCRRCASGSVRNCDCGERLSPSWRIGWSRRAKAALGRAGWVRGRRRESIPGGLAAASMRRTLPRTQPARPLTVSGGRPPRKKERRATAGRALRLLAAEHGSALQRALQDQRKRTRRKPRPFSFPSVRQYTNALAHRHRETVRGGAGWVGGGASAMDGAHKPPGMDSRRPPTTQPVPPDSQQHRAALALASARRRRTTARQRGASTSSPIGQLTPVPPIPQ